MTRIRTLLVALCSTFMLIPDVWAQAASGDNKPSGDNSIDCPKDMVSASGTGSSQAMRPHRSSAKAVEYAKMHGNMPGPYAQCTGKSDRGARAQCVRTAYESRFGTSGTLTASSSSRRPC